MLFPLRRPAPRFTTGPIQHEGDLAEFGQHLTRENVWRVKARRAIANAIGSGSVGVKDADGMSYAVLTPYTNATYGNSGGPASGDDMVIFDLGGYEVVVGKMNYR